MNLNIFNTDKRQQIVNADNSQNESRAVMVEEIADLKTERADKIRPLTSDLQRATTAVEDAQQQLLLAKAQQHTADSKLRQVIHTTASQISRIEKELVATAPEVINTFCDELNEDARKLRSKGVTKTGKKSNIKSFNVLLSAMREAIIEAEKLKLLAVPDTASRLQALRTGLPAITMQ